MGVIGADFGEFSARSYAQPVFGCVVRVSVIVAPEGILLIVHVANNRRRDQNDGYADDQSSDYLADICPLRQSPGHPRVVAIIDIRLNIQLLAECYHEDLSMIIDTHTHVWSFPSYGDLSQHIKTTEDLIAFRTRYPELYNCSLTEEPVDNSDALIADMDKNDVALTLVQARPGYVTNDQVAQAAARHSDRLQAIARVGHDQEAAGYHDDPGPTREQAPEEIERCLTKLKMRGVGEIFIRSLTNEIHPERIAKDLDGLMEVVSKYGVPIQFPTAWSQFPGGLFYGDPLWVDEVALRHPKVPIILTKMGRSVGRYFDSAMTVAMRNVNIYFDVVGTNPQHLRSAIDKIGPHRIMFGTDWSATWRWISVPTTLHKLRLKVLDDAKVTDDERRMILWDNAVEVFKLGKEAEKARSVFRRAAE